MCHDGKRDTAHGQADRDMPVSGFEEEVNLDYLAHHWSDAYEISYSHRTYRAHRRDDGTEFTAGSAEALLEQIRADCTDPPPHIIDLFEQAAADRGLRPEPWPDPPRDGA